MRKRKTTPAVVAALALLTSCSGEGGHRGADRASASGAVAAVSPHPSPSPTRTGPLLTGPGVLPGEKPPELRPEGRVHDTLGAILFAKYFIKALSWSIATNDSWLIKQLSAPSCQACQSYIDAAEALHRDGQQQRGGRPTALSWHARNASAPNGAEIAIEFVIDESAATLTPSQKTLPAKHGVQSIVFLKWSEISWVVVEQAAP